jgi:hypothetical protein
MAAMSKQPQPVHGGAAENYAVVRDVAASWADYAQVTSRLLEPTPAGLLIHIAGPTEEGVRTIDVWESEQVWQRFEAERLAPAIADLGGPSPPETRSRSLHPIEVVVGDPQRDLANTERKEEA